MTTLTRASVFVQWKGTDACIDFRCPCGAMPHYDGMFAYVLRCPGCGRLWKMPDTFHLEEVEPDGGMPLEESWSEHSPREGPDVVEVGEEEEPFEPGVTRVELQVDGAWTDVTDLRRPADG